MRSITTATEVSWDTMDLFGEWPLAMAAITAGAHLGATGSGVPCDLHPLNGPALAQGCTALPLAEVRRKCDTEAPLRLDPDAA